MKVGESLGKDWMIDVELEGSHLYIEQGTGHGDRINIPWDLIPEFIEACRKETNIQSSREKTMKVGHNIEVAKDGRNLEIKQRRPYRSGTLTDNIHVEAADIQYLQEAIAEVMGPVAIQSTSLPVYILIDFISNLANEASGDVMVQGWAVKAREALCKWDEERTKLAKETINQAEEVKVPARPAQPSPEAQLDIPPRYRLLIVNGKGECYTQVWFNNLPSVGDIIMYPGAGPGGKAGHRKLQVLGINYELKDCYGLATPTEVRVMEIK